ncbi:MAG: permease-like cell division protein FtsX [Candidatus Paceibacterota bacterium]|jgi:cell division transport system permease protein
MKRVTTKRIIKAGFVSFVRNSFVSLSSILVVTITLSVITMLIFLQAVLNFSLEQIKDKVDVSIYFTTSASVEKIEALKSTIEKLPEVTSVSYTSSEDALKNFKEKHTNDFLTLQALEELDKNPLGAYLNIKAKDPSQYEAISSFLQGDTALVKDSSTIIDKINYYQNKEVIERLNAITNGAQKLGFALTLILAIVSVVITFNTIRLTIFTAREEIGVMRLVGAGSRYVRGPFMIEGIIYGVFSAVTTMILFWPISYWFGKKLTTFLGMNLYDYYLSSFFQIFGIILLVGVLLGSISSFIAVKKYLNK